MTVNIVEFRFESLTENVFFYFQSIFSDRPERKRQQNKNRAPVDSFHSNEK